MSARKNKASLLPLGLVDDAQLRTTRRLSRSCAEPPRLCDLAWHPANSVWQSRLSSCRAAIMGNSEIIGLSCTFHYGSNAEKFCSTRGVLWRCPHRTPAFDAWHFESLKEPPSRLLFSEDFLVSERTLNPVLIREMIVLA
jgi:hypothetical protein